VKPATRALLDACLAEFPELARVPFPLDACAACGAPAPDRAILASMAEALVGDGYVNILSCPRPDCQAEVSARGGVNGRSAKHIPGTGGAS